MNDKKFIYRIVVINGSGEKKATFVLSKDIEDAISCIQKGGLWKGYSISIVSVNRVGVVSNECNNIFIEYRDK